MPDYTEDELRLAREIVQSVINPDNQTQIAETCRIIAWRAALAAIRETTERAAKLAYNRETSEVVALDIRNNEHLKGDRL